MPIERQRVESMKEEAAAGEDDGKAEAPVEEAETEGWLLLITGLEIGETSVEAVPAGDFNKVPSHGIAAPSDGADCPTPDREEDSSRETTFGETSSVDSLKSNGSATTVDAMETKLPLFLAASRLSRVAQSSTGKESLESTTTG